MKRVQLQLPDPVVAWIDLQVDGIESRAAFIRRSIVALMKADQQHQHASGSGAPPPAEQPMKPPAARLS